MARRGKLAFLQGTKLQISRRKLKIYWQQKVVVVLLAFSIPRAPSERDPGTERNERVRHLGRLMILAVGVQSDNILHRNRSKKLCSSRIPFFRVLRGTLKISFSVYLGLKFRNIFIPRRHFSCFLRAPQSMQHMQLRVERS